MPSEAANAYLELEDQACLWSAAAPAALRLLRLLLLLLLLWLGLLLSGSVLLDGCEREDVMPSCVLLLLLLST
jgi:hypothetical protein